MARADARHAAGTRLAGRAHALAETAAHRRRHRLVRRTTLPTVGHRGARREWRVAGDAIGTAGVPGGSLPLVVIVLQTVGVPADGIGIILGVDRLLDMCRTTLNVTGDLAIAACVDRAEGGQTPAPPAIGGLPS